MDWNDARNYKQCRKTQYDIWACIPPAGIFLVNKLEQVDALEELGGRTFFTQEQLAVEPVELAEKLEAMAAKGDIYKTKPGTLVLSGTRGELWTAKLSKLETDYAYEIDGEYVQDLNLLLERCGIKCGDDTLLPWIKVRSTGAGTAVACFASLDEQGVIDTGWALSRINDPRVSHGLGDFVLCSSLNDFSNKWVVNGEVFADTYDNSGWEDCLAESSGVTNAPEPEPLFSRR